MEVFFVLNPEISATLVFPKKSTLGLLGVGLSGFVRSFKIIGIPATIFFFSMRYVGLVVFDLPVALFDEERLPELFDTSDFVIEPCDFVNDVMD